MKSYYGLLTAPATHCPKCNKAVSLLIDTERVGSPSFYICFDCKYVGHVGIGPVESGDSEEQDHPAEKKEILPPGISLHYLTEIIARNCVAWDNSKDKRTGLLPEVYISDCGLYKKLTGEEYTQYGACRKFNIGE